MNTNPTPPAGNDKDTAPTVQPPRKLDLSPADAEREAAKLRELRESLEERPGPDAGDARSSPIGRHDE